MHMARHAAPKYSLSASDAAQLRALEHMSVGELATKFQSLFGVPTRTRNKQYLRKRIAFCIQERALGGLSPRALEKIEELAPQAPVRWQTRLPVDPPPMNRERDPRLPPPGERLTRNYEGREYEVAVLQEGFEYAGRQFRTLSQVAKAITGTTWNGFLFFGLTQRKERR